MYFSIPLNRIMFDIETTYIACCSRLLRLSIFIKKEKQYYTLLQHWMDRGVCNSAILVSINSIFITDWRRTNGRKGYGLIVPLLMLILSLPKFVPETRSPNFSEIYLNFHFNLCTAFTLLKIVFVYEGRGCQLGHWIVKYTAQNSSIFVKVIQMYNTITLSVIVLCICRLLGYFVIQKCIIAYYQW